MSAGAGPRTAAVLGKPIAHSLSPVLHRAAYRELGLDWQYSAIECDEPELPALLAGSDPAVVGYSCTMPLKRAVLAVADQVSPLAAAIGAGNTLLRTGDGWLADNTDWQGIRDALAASELPVLPGSVLLLGAGGTAQAALAALAGMVAPAPASAANSASITVLVRDRSRTGELQASAERLGLQLAFGELSELDRLGSADLVISTLPGTAADPLARAGWRAGQALLDVVYQPWPTALAAAAAAGGASVISGARMLLWQAAAQVELMTGRAAPVAAMRAALLAAVPGCGC